MIRWDIINTLINKINATKYLEIGIDNRHNFDKIKCDYKIGVDPNRAVNCTFNMTSDEFFRQNNHIFDIIFIDGLHHADQVHRDIENALKYLSPNGYIVCHDMNPDNEITQMVPRQTIEWTGDCWKAWIKIRSTNPNVSMFVVDTDCGCGVITRGKQELISLDCEITYTNLEKNRKNWLNLISARDFLNYAQSINNEPAPSSAQR